MRTKIREAAGARWMTRAFTLAMGTALVGALPMAAAAQQVSHEVNILLNADGTQGLDLRTVRRSGFQLHAAGDAALTGMRMTGNHGASFSNYADCTNVLYSCQNQRMVRAADGATVALWFYNSWIAGAPPSDWRKIRDVQPSVGNALGGGWTAGFNEELTGGRTRWGPADLTLGALFSGVASTSDGTCRDNTGFGNASVPSGIPLLPQSICPDTWASGGFEGGVRISGEGWLDYVADVGTATFNFDFWRVPDAYTSPGFLGNLMHAYGETTDYYENIRNAFGSVIPGGTGAPALQGYPLGLKIRFDVFTFAVPSVNSVKFVRALVINRSEDVYGTGVDYDSLYFGISPGDLGSAQTATAWYNLPELNSVVRVRAGNVTSGPVVPCNESAREPVFTCGTTNGWQSGSQAIAFLKSPIGDQRNKLFTRTAAGTACTPGTDPFCDPSNPLRGDTFTINHTRMCGFGACNTFVWVGGGARSGFGHLSGTEDNTLNGRDINAQTATFAWSTFRSPVWPNRAVYSKWQPDPSWDYNRDGTPDTLGFTSCNLTGCAALASDTQPGGFVNLSSNVGGLHAAGPFHLGAGDTTSFWYAVIGERDSIGTMSQLNAAIDLYMNFFLAPEAPPASEVVSTQLRAGTDALGTIAPQVEIFFSDAAQRWTDPFLSKLANDITTAGPGTELANLLALNPGLDAMVAARASDNLERIEVYKSCDGGTSFTSDGDCVGDPATDEDGGSLALGWQAYRTFSADAPDGIPSSFTDGNVQGGREYLYVIIGKSRGATFLLNGTGGAPIEFEFAPSIRNVLSRSTSDPNVVSVYVPASRASGFIAATATVTARPVEGTVPFDLDFSETVAPGSYTATLGNVITVHRDSLAGQPVSSSTIVTERVVTADVGGVATPTTIFTNTVTRTGSDVFPFAGTGTTGAPTLQADGVTWRVTTTYSGLGFVVARGNTAFFGSNTLTGSAATPSALFRLADYPGFIVSVDNSVAGSFNTGGEQHLRGAESIARLGLTAADTVTPRGIVNGFMPQWQEATTLTVKTASGGGRYEVTWTDDAYGAPSGFIMNRTNPSATQAEVQAALEARAVGTTGLTDAATAALTGIPQSDLVAVTMPFTIRNTTYNRDVRVAMARRVNNRIVLGIGQDTMSIGVPEDEWVPGDALVLIEDVAGDSATAVGVVLSGGAPLQVTHPRVTFTSAVIGCNTAVRLTCNPIPSGSPGATGYNPISPGDRTVAEYYTSLVAGTQFAFDVTEPVSGADITAISDSALANIRVVPNPFVIYSTYQNTASDARILFTNLPPAGTLRIYTVAGQFTQQITWTAADLVGTGDLFFNLRTREGIDMASGLYIWVINAPSDPTNPNSAQLRTAGKFVIIRGSAQ